MELNPGAPSQPSAGELLHLRAVGDNDTLHFLFCSQGAPSLLLVHTNTSSSVLQVNWTQFEQRNTTGGLRVEPESSVVYSTALVLSRLLEYDDQNDTATPLSGAASFFPPQRLQDITWSNFNLSTSDLCGSTPCHSAKLCGSAPSFASGQLCLRLKVFGEEGRSLAWPRLLHSANSSQLELWLDGVPARAARSRFLLELAAVGGANPPSRTELRRSIDDEFTPSIFKEVLWLPQSNGSSHFPSFVQWKPVAYREAPPTLEAATSCGHSPPQQLIGQEVAAAAGLVRAFYLHDPQSFGLNVSFGQAGEPFYNSSHFLSWTLLIGSGSPPADFLSPLVIVMMAVGLGVPLLLLLVGGACVCIRKRASPANYQPIN